jgi:hypothetical protein
MPLREGGCSRWDPLFHIRVVSCHLKPLQRIVSGALSKTTGVGTVLGGWEDPPQGAEGTIHQLKIER